MNQKRNRFSPLIDNLEKLIFINSPSGYESEIQEFFKEVLSGSNLKTWSDGRNAYGIIGNLKNDKPRILISAHCDEICMHVKSITEEGFITITENTGFKKVLPGLEVVVKGKKDIPAVIGSKPPHLLCAGETAKLNPIDGLLVDTGLSRAEIIESISVGDPVLYRKQFLELKNNRFAGTGIDNKVSVEILIELAKKLANVNLPVNVIFACTSFEEIGSMGASLAFENIKPDIALSIDTFSANQFGNKTLNNSEIINNLHIGNGALMNQEISDALFETAKNLKIKTNNMIFEGLGGEIKKYIFTDLGCPSGILSLPIRNLHQPVEMFDANMAYDCISVLDEFLRGVPENLKGLMA